jgi:phosphoserine phosphatase SerB
MIRLEVSIDDQRVDVFSNNTLLRSFPASTAAKGVGFTPNSGRTPTGNFRIAAKIGDGLPQNTRFRARKPVGFWEPGAAAVEDPILCRIMTLEGVDQQNLNTLERYIYFHGTHREDLLGTPASHGCIRLANRDMLELFDLVPEGAAVFISKPSRRRGKLLFMDCDSTLSSIEGIDELARFRGPAVYDEVVALTNAAMNGEVALDEVFPRRMEIIRPDRAACDFVAARYVETITPGASALVAALKSQGWLPVILSGGFLPLIEPLAATLGIQYVEAVPLNLDELGNYAGYDATYPTTRNLGKNEIIREWKAALLPERVAMIGDGISDLETTPDVDVFIGFGGVVQRPAVMAGTDCWLQSMSDFEKVNKFLENNIIPDSRFS